MALNYDTKKHRVHLKAKWQDEWELQEHLYADSMTFCAAPEIPEAVLAWHYGEVKQYTASKIAAVPKFDKMLPFANLMVSVLQLYGIETETYGKGVCASNGQVSLA